MNEPLMTDSMISYTTGFSLPPNKNFISFEFQSPSARNLIFGFSKTNGFDDALEQNIRELFVRKCGDAKATGHWYVQRQWDYQKNWTDETFIDMLRNDDLLDAMKATITLLMEIATEAVGSVNSPATT